MYVSPFIGKLSEAARIERRQMAKIELSENDCTVGSHAVGAGATAASSFDHFHFVRCEITTRIYFDMLSANWQLKPVLVKSSADAINVRHAIFRFASV